MLLQCRYVVAMPFMLLQCRENRYVVVMRIVETVYVVGACLSSGKFVLNQNFVIFLFVALLAVTTLYILLRFTQFVVDSLKDEYELDNGAACSGRMRMTLYCC